MKRPGLVVLGSATLALLGYLSLGSKRARAVDPDHPRIFSHFDQTSIRSIAFEGEGFARERLERTSKEDPHAYHFENGKEADPSRIGPLLSSLESASYLRRFENDEADGSRRPVLSVRLSTESEGEFALEFFAGPSKSIETFCRREPGAPRSCGTLSRTLFERLARSPTYYRDARIVPWPIRDIGEISFAQGGRSTKLRNSALGFVDESGVRLARGSVESGLRLLIDARLLREHSGTPEGVPAKIRFARKSGEEQSIDLFESCGNDAREASIRFEWGSEFCVPKSVLDARELFFARSDRHLLPFREDELDHVVLAGPLGRLDVVRKDSDFELLGESPRRLDRERGREFFSFLASLEGEPTTLPERPTDAEWSFFGFGPTSDAPSEYRLRVHFTPESVIASAEKLTLRFPRSAILEGAPETLASLPLLGFEPRELSFLVREGKISEEVVRPGENLENLSSAAEEIVSLLSRLRAESYLRDSRLDASTDSLSTFSIGLSNSSKPRTLRLVKRTLGGYVATLDGEPRPFLLARRVGDALTQSLTSTPLVLEESIVKRTLVVRTSLGSLSLVPEEEGYRVEPERRLGDPEAFVEKLFEIHGTPFEETFRPSAAPLLAIEAKNETGKPSFELVVHSRTTLRDRAAFVLTSSDVRGPFVVEARLVETLLGDL